MPAQSKAGWGAFMVYAGVDGGAIPDHAPLHHQVIVREPLGEGNSVFVSVSPGWDKARAPQGRRAVTIRIRIPRVPKNLAAHHGR